MKRLWLVLALIACEAPTAVRHDEVHMAEIKPGPVRQIVDRKEDWVKGRDDKLNGGTYVLGCGHSVKVTGEDWDECVMWEWPCAQCLKEGA